MRQTTNQRFRRIDTRHVRPRVGSWSVSLYIRRCSACISDCGRLWSEITQGRRIRPNPPVIRARFISRYTPGPAGFRAFISGWSQQIALPDRYSSLCLEAVLPICSAKNVNGNSLQMVADMFGRLDRIAHRWFIWLSYCRVRIRLALGAQAIESYI